MDIRRLHLRARLGRLFVLAMSVTLWLAFFGTPCGAETAPRCAVVNIHEIGWNRLAGVKATEDVSWWIELDDELVVCGSDVAIATLATKVEVLAWHQSLDPQQLRIARGFHRTELASLGLDVIASAGGVALVWSDDFAQFDAQESVQVDRWRGFLAPVIPDSVLVRQIANDMPRPRLEFAPQVQSLVDMVDGNRWFDDVVTLASYNRYTRNAGIHDARDWLVSQLDALPGLGVTTPSFDALGTTAYNVVATLIGHTRPDDWYIIGGHYDSISDNPQVEAPGAEDNGSGCAGVLEMARILTAAPPEATTIFICYSAEELGLIGSEDHVDDLIAAGDLAKVQTMLDLDMIGYTSDTDLDCKLETDPFAVSLFDIFEDAALQFTSLRIVTDTSACCSDHKPYLLAGVPALLTIEADWFQYPYYHTVNDLPVHLTIDMGREILKMNVGAMAQMIGASEPPLFADGFESGDTSAWFGLKP